MPRSAGLRHGSELQAEQTPAPRGMDLKVCAFYRQLALVTLAIAEITAEAKKSGCGEGGWFST